MSCVKMTIERAVHSSSLNLQSGSGVSTWFSQIVHRGRSNNIGSPFIIANIIDQRLDCTRMQLRTYGHDATFHSISGRVWPRDCPISPGCFRSSKLQGRREAQGAPTKTTKVWIFPQDLVPNSSHVDLHRYLVDLSLLIFVYMCKFSSSSLLQDNWNATHSFSTYFVSDAGHLESWCSSEGRIEGSSVVRRCESRGGFCCWFGMYEYLFR